MALRVEAIQHARGPLGAVAVEDLSRFDLIVVSGPNGAGKSTLLKPLQETKADAQVRCIDQVTGAAQEFSTRGVRQTVAFITSVELLKQFRDLSQALAMAANATRPSEEAQLLEQLARQLERGGNGQGPAEPAGLGQLRQDFLEADRRCGDRPRTAGEYDRLGRALASRKGLVWNRPDLDGDAGARRQAELSLQPESRTLAGLETLRPHLTALVGLPVPSSAAVSAAWRAAGLDAKLRAALERVWRMPGVTAAGPQVAASDAAAAAVKQLRDASSRCRQLLAALNLLQTTRTDAHRYLVQQVASGAPAPECPVCGGPINHAALAQSLADQVARTEDAQAKQWMAQRDAADAACDELDSLARELQAASESARREHEAVRVALAKVVPSLHPSSDSAESVRQAADHLRERCDRWTREWATTPGSAALDAARQLAADAAKAGQDLESEARRLNDGLGEAQEDFRRLQSLGAALAAAGALDRVAWEASLDQVDADRRRSEQRERWLRVLAQMVQERQAQAGSASGTVVQDAGVQGRFQTLVERLHSLHPSLQGLKFCGHAVEVQGQDRGNSLSEGQRVLVNIAAAMAVVGKVAGTPEHKPGWIVFDEPTNGLDEASRSQVAEYLGGLRKDQVSSQIIVATFDREFAAQLITAAGRAGRAVKHVELPPLQPGRDCVPVVRTF